MQSKLKKVRKYYRNKKLTKKKLKTGLDMIFKFNIIIKKEEELSELKRVMKIFNIKIILPDGENNIGIYTAKRDNDGYFLTFSDSDIDGRELTAKVFIIVLMELMTYPDGYDLNARIHTLKHQQMGTAEMRIARNSIYGAFTANNQEAIHSLNHTYGKVSLPDSSTNIDDLVQSLNKYPIDDLLKLQDGIKELIDKRTAVMNAMLAESAAMYPNNMKLLHGEDKGHMDDKRFIFTRKTIVFIRCIGELLIVRNILNNHGYIPPINTEEEIMKVKYPVILRYDTEGSTWILDDENFITAPHLNSEEYKRKAETSPDFKIPLRKV